MIADVGIDTVSELMRICPPMMVNKSKVLYSIWIRYYYCVCVGVTLVTTNRSLFRWGLVCLWTMGGSDLASCIAAVMQSRKYHQQPIIIITYPSTRAHWGVEVCQYNELCFKRKEDKTLKIWIFSGKEKRIRLMRYDVS
ncbi:hypothetical protein K449DRAFT_258459 [Hypoxylon sp. EC38]|nr:hypothetical protein K449DRAFT_258459 [Hypoxylon sp. EC38]